MNFYYDPAHHSFVGFAIEVGNISESFDGTDPASMPAHPIDFALCGYTNHPEGKRGLNNSYGFSIGQRGGAYRKRGNNAPTLSLVLRGGGAIELLQRLARNASDELSSLCFFVGVPPMGGSSGTGWTDLYRYAKINSMSLALKETNGEAAEIEVALQVEATCRQSLATSITPSNMASKLNTLREPLYWHDVHAVNLGDENIRQALSGMNIQISHNIERKGERPNWGDNQPLSRTSYLLQEHTVTVSGDMQLNCRFPHTFFTGTHNAQSWGDITLSISNEGLAGTGKEQTIELTLQTCMPTDESNSSAEPKAQLTYSVPFVAADYVLNVTGS